MQIFQISLYLLKTFNFPLNLPITIKSNNLDFNKKLENLTKNKIVEIQHQNNKYFIKVEKEYLCLDKKVILKDEKCFYGIESVLYHDSNQKRLKSKNTNMMVTDLKNKKIESSEKELIKITNFRKNNNFDEIILKKEKKCFNGHKMKTNKNGCLILKIQLKENECLESKNKKKDKKKELEKKYGKLGDKINKVVEALKKDYEMPRFELPSWFGISFSMCTR